MSQSNRVVLRDAIAAAVIAGLVFQALRQWVGERYLVPSGSMQPTLYGARHGGDVVYVDKLASAAGLRRYDLGVFERAADAAVLVKRAVAFGDEPEACCVELRDGDLWLGPAPPTLRRAVKEPLQVRSLRVPWLRWPIAAAGDPYADALSLGDGDTADGRLVPRHASLADARAACGDAARRALAQAVSEHGERSGGGWLATLRVIDATYLDRNGSRGEEGAAIAVDDIGMDLQLRLGPATTAVLCGLELRPDAWTFHWQPATGACELWRNGVTVATRPLAPLAAGTTAVRLEFGYLDGQFFFAVGGGQSLWIEPRRVDWLVADPGPSGWSLPKNRLVLATIGPEPSPVRSLEVFRDIHWYRLPLAVGVDPARFSPVVTVPPGQVYLLGDNGADSRDSRMFGPVPLADFVGRPRACLGPWPHARWLSH